MAQPTIEVKGIQEALAALNKIDPTYRRKVTVRIKNAGQVMVNEARSMVTTIVGVKGAPLSGMSRGSLIKGKDIHWRTDAVQAGFKIKAGVRGTKERYVNFNRYTDGVQTHTEQIAFGAKPYKLMVMQQADAAGAIYDHAGRNSSGLFVTNLNAEGGGQQPRVIDIAVEKNKPAVQNVVQGVISDVEKMTNRTLRQRAR